MNPDTPCSIVILFDDGHYDRVRAAFGDHHQIVMELRAARVGITETILVPEISQADWIPINEAMMRAATGSEIRKSLEDSGAIPTGSEHLPDRTSDPGQETQT